MTTHSQSDAGAASTQRSHHHTERHHTERHHAEQSDAVQKAVLAYWLMAAAFLPLSSLHLTNTSLLLIQHQYALDLAQLGAVNSWYLLCEVAVMPLMPLLQHYLGLQRLALLALAGFTLSSLGAASADSVHGLLLCRAAQGGFGGLLLPLVHSALRLLIRPQRQAGAFGLFSTLAASATVFGPLAAGALQHQAYYWLFLTPALLAVPVLCGIWCCPRDVPEQSAEKIQWSAAWSPLTLAGALAFLVYVLEHGHRLDWFSDRSIRLALAGSLFCFACSAWLQCQAGMQVLRLSLLKGSFGLICLASFIVGLLVYAVVFFIPLYLSQILQASPQTVATVVLITALPQLLVLPLISRLSRYCAPQLLFCGGAALAALMCWSLSNLTPAGTDQQFTSGQLWRVAAVPFLIIPLTVWSLNITVSSAASAAILFNLARSLGGICSIAGFVALLEWSAQRWWQQQLLLPASNHSVSTDWAAHAYNSGFNQMFLILSLLATFVALAGCYAWLRAGTPVFIAPVSARTAR